MQIVRGRAPETTPTQSRTETFTGRVVVHAELNEDLRGYGLAGAAADGVALSGQVIVLNDHPAQELVLDHYRRPRHARYVRAPAAMLLPGRRGPP